MRGEQNLGDYIAATKKLRADIERAKPKVAVRPKEKDTKGKGK